MCQKLALTISILIPVGLMNRPASPMWGWRTRLGKWALAWHTYGTLLGWSASGDRGSLCLRRGRSFLKSAQPSHLFLQSRCRSRWPGRPAWSMPRASPPRWGTYASSGARRGGAGRGSWISPSLGKSIGMTMVPSVLDIPLPTHTLPYSHTWAMGGCWGGFTYTLTSQKWPLP